MRTTPGRLAARRRCLCDYWLLNVAFGVAVALKPAMRLVPSDSIVAPPARFRPVALLRIVLPETRTRAPEAKALTPVPLLSDADESVTEMVEVLLAARTPSTPLWLKVERLTIAN